MSQDQDQLVKSAVLGKQVEDFMASDVGRFFKERIIQERAEAITGFANCDPTDQKEVLKWQNQLVRADAMITWISGVIRDGLTAVHILETGE